MSKFRRNRSTVVVIADPALTRLEEFAKLAGVDVDLYVVQAALHYPHVLDALNRALKESEEVANELEAAVPAGTSEAQPSQEG